MLLSDPDVAQDKQHDNDQTDDVDHSVHYELLTFRWPERESPTVAYQCAHWGPFGPCTLRWLADGRNSRGKGFSLL
jgi:hypothetical protein